MKGCEMTGTCQPIRDALFTSLALWWLVLKKFLALNVLQKVANRYFVQKLFSLRSKI